MLICMDEFVKIVPTKSNLPLESTKYRYRKVCSPSLDCSLNSFPGPLCSAGSVLLHFLLVGCLPLQFLLSEVVHALPKYSTDADQSK